MNIESTLDEMKSQWSSWEEVFKYANKPQKVEGAKCHKESFTVEDVEEVLGSVEGENDGPDWVAVFKLKDGRFAVLRAGCDYTGWG